MKLFFCIFLYCFAAHSSPVLAQKGKPVFALADFRKTVELNGKVVVLPGVVRPMRLTLIPEKGVLMCLEGPYDSKRKWLHIFSLDSLKLIQSLIKNGTAEGEMLAAFQLQYNSQNGGEVYITDAQKQQVFIYKADSLIAGKEKPFKIIGKPFSGNIALSINTDRLMRAVVTDKSHTVVDTRASALNDSRMLFNKYRNNLSIRDSFGLYPKTTEEIAPFMLSGVLNGCLGISTDSRYLIFSGLSTDYLAVYDTSGKMIASAIGPGELDVRYTIDKMSREERIIPSSDHRAYSGKSKMNKGTVYALYNGKNSRVKGTNANSSEIFQFNSQLQPQTRYKLSVPVFDFDIDWRTGRLYGFRIEDPIHKLVIFQL